MTIARRVLLTALICWPSAAFGQGMIEGIVVDCLSGTPVSGVRVDLLGISLQTITGGNGRFVLQNLPGTTHSLRARAIGYQTVVVPSVTVGTNVVILLNGTCDAILLRSNVNGSPATPETVVLLEAARYESGNVNWYDDLLVTDDSGFEWIVLLPGDLRDPGNMGSDIAVFSHGDAMQFHQASGAWSNSSNDLFDGGELVDPFEIPLKIWLAAPGAAAVWGDDLTKLIQVFEGNPSGLTFSIVGGTASAITSVPTGCNVIADVLADTNYDPAAINVYYVSEINSSSPLAGQACVGWYEGANVVFIDTENRNVATLTHEIGHVLGLFLPWWGHPGKNSNLQNIDGFESTNIMWDAADPTREHISLGQAYRMNLHNAATYNASFINMPWEGNPPIRAGPTTACQCDPYAPQPCPRLGLDLGESGSQTTTLLPVCEVVITTPSPVNVPVGQTFQLTAETYYMYDPTQTGPNYQPLGRPVGWVSSLPTVATIDDQGLITGQAVGCASIIAYGRHDGTWTTRNISVGGAACP